MTPNVWLFDVYERVQQTISAKWVQGVSLLLACAACAGPRPILYPNRYYEQVGDAQAQRDIEECMERARAFTRAGGAAAGQARRVVRSTATGAAAGAAVGAVGSAVSGGDAGRGAAVGAATGATGGFLASILHPFESRGTDPVFANFVERCLRDKGYEPIGWR
jgi:outer membrane lipoprotein SlyB